MALLEVKSQMPNFFPCTESAPSLFIHSNRVIQDMVRMERALDQCLARLEERTQLLNPEGGDWSHHDDDLDSIASTGSMIPSSMNQRVRFFGPGREAERLKRKVMNLERENFALKQQLEDMQRVVTAVRMRESKDDDDDDNDNPALLPEGRVNGSKTLHLQEKDVWNVLRTHQRR